MVLAWVVDFVIGIGVDYMIGFGVISKLAMARHGLGAKNSLGIDAMWRGIDVGYWNGFSC